MKLTVAFAAVHESMDNPNKPAVRNNVQRLLRSKRMKFKGGAHGD